jgi:hypothetical protein
MVRRRIVGVALAVWLGLGVVAAPAAEATTVVCGIPSGPHRVAWSSGCASAKWIRSGSGGEYWGYVHDRSSGSGTVVVEYQAPSGVWRWLASDTYDGSSMTRLGRYVSESTCRPVRARDSSGTYSLAPC